MRASKRKDMMKTTKHTPGPWETGGVMTLVEFRPEGWNAPMCIADCHTKNAPQSETERVANARLIAAAPELLEACKAAMNDKYARFGMTKDNYPVREILARAITKAEGGAS